MPPTAGATPGRAAEGETLIAKCWRRAIPTQRYEVIVVFP
jgi:hypothetical protein